MINFIRRKLEKARLKRTFQEYGYDVNVFAVEGYGKIEYAQWLHPFESKKEITRKQIDFFGQFISKGDFIIDIGAHTGDTTVPMAVATGKEGVVLGLEPNPYVFKILQKNADLNPTSGKIIPLPFAATQQEGTFVFNYSDASFCNGGYLDKIKNNKHNHHYELEVQGINLQDYLQKEYQNSLPRLALLKVDAEGYDKEILKTLPVILETFRPTILAECYKRLDQEERADLYQTIATKGYYVFKIDDFEENTNYRLLNEAQMNEEKHFEILAIHSSNKTLLAKLGLSLND